MKNRKYSTTVWRITEKEKRTVNEPKYLNRIIGSPIVTNYKFCKVFFNIHPYRKDLSYNESWAPNWIYDGKECFLVLFQKFSDTYRILCEGLDDLGYELEFPKDDFQKAKDMYDLISHGTSQDELMDLGFVHM